MNSHVFSIMVGNLRTSAQFTRTFFGHRVHSTGLICWRLKEDRERLKMVDIGFAPIFPDTCYHLTHYWPAAADIPVASDNPVHYADAIRYNARTPLQGSLLPLTRLV
ncbi:protein FimG-like protein [Escherichia coli]|nr:protein FimG-like protein [Escherichia coli]SQR21389.1 protein FimG-like protein [Escherichia coli]